ncbi:signal transduction histidine kinase [Cryobacterium sp. MP_3.1]|uniref:Histidine kinase n=1 Tax=Cryobacterium zongtaii TaxID=1259217 RepID=A0A2S3ZHD7_9MICO|nr:MULTISPECIES: ATP-binding protein [Cryobacterium]MEC5184303.1 signal transduction histidine kinase [Cryobacterium sp. MP_3.1]POH66823.1 histidine kinase [Cryobacterium zongtaii]
MPRIARERDRVLRRSARITGLTASVTSLAYLAVPGGLDASVVLFAGSLILLMAGCQYVLGQSGALRWAVCIVLLSNAVILVVGLATRVDVGLNPVEEALIATLAAGGASCVAPVLVVGPGRQLILFGSFGMTVAGVAFVTISSGGSVLPLVLTVCGWAALSLGGWWIAQSVPRVLQRVAAIGRAHQAERHASELEAQRRQGARLLHDTVLATLTLLAHSGVGVSPAALRQQSGDDARLLRQLRLGALPTPSRSGVYTLEPSNTSMLGSTLESVKQRFGRMGLEVDWHGSGQVLLPSDVLDSFLLALGECLENVRRHSGVTRADVTISDDDTTVRAMVTDAGRGFDLSAVGTERLGFAESVVARLRDVGGSARLFSSPGSGTTVVLEVPK